MVKDKIYDGDNPQIADFAFDATTAAVFEDMLERSVPFYAEIQRQIGELTADFATDGSVIVDLGCSLGTTIQGLDSIAQDVSFLGIDASEAMLARADAALAPSMRHRYELRRADLNDSLHIVNASVVIMSLTLQFVRPLYRQRVLAEVYEGLNPNGCLLLIEKVGVEESLLNRLYIEHYYDFKRRNGYSRLEIARKREALENVLIPYRMTENEEMLRNVGFRAVDAFFKWYNFAGLIALK